MRFKIERDNPNIYRCCLCCHVRTGTIFLGIFHLLLHLLAFAVIALLVVHPELIKTRDPDAPNQLVGVLESDAPKYMNNLSIETSKGYSYTPWFANKREWTGEDKFITLLLTMGSFLLTLMLVYGAAKGRPGYLMPFFCLQVFDFCVSCLTVVSGFSYTTSVRDWIKLQEDFPYKEELLSLNGDWLTLLAIMALVLILTIKAYFIGVVWACYKYLTYYQNNVANVVRAYNVSTNPEDTEMLLPPKYEDVLTMPQGEEPPPPPYQPN